MNNFIPTIQKEVKKKKPPYRKPESVKQLELSHTAWKYKGRNIPYHVKTKLTDNTANGLAKCLKAWADVNEAHFQRMNTTGLYDPKLKKYRRSGATKGVTDTLIIYQGKTLHIEIKIGKDKQSDNQKEIQQSIESAGGVYLIVNSFDHFIEQIKNINNQK